MKKKALGPWLSVVQLADRYGYSQSTIRRWIEQLEQDTRISEDQRSAILYGPKRARRIHEVLFSAWLSTRPAGRDTASKTVVFVYTTPAVQ